MKSQVNGSCQIFYSLIYMIIGLILAVLAYHMGLQRDRQVLSRLHAVLFLNLCNVGVEESEETSDVADSIRD